MDLVKCSISNKATGTYEFLVIETKVHWKTFDGRYELKLPIKLSWLCICGWNLTILFQPGWIFGNLIHKMRENLQEIKITKGWGLSGVGLNL